MAGKSRGKVFNRKWGSELWHVHHLRGMTFKHVGCTSTRDHSSFCSFLPTMATPRSAVEAAHHHLSTSFPDGKRFLMPFPVKGKLIPPSRSLYANEPLLILCPLGSDTFSPSSVCIYKIAKILNENLVSACTYAKESSRDTLWRKTCRKKKNARLPINSTPQCLSNQGICDRFYPVILFSWVLTTTFLAIF